MKRNGGVLKIQTQNAEIHGRFDENPANNANSNAPKALRKFAYWSEKAGPDFENHSSAKMLLANPWGNS
jgi:hypothetical protein